MGSLCSIEVVQSAFKLVHEQLTTFKSFANNHKLSWTTRVVFGQCIKEFLQLDITALGTDGEEWLIDLNEMFLRLVEDESFHVRKYMSRAITIFFRLYSDQVQIFNDISIKLLPFIFNSGFYFFFHCLFYLNMCM